jgi:hypothetical protein
MHPILQSSKKVLICLALLASVTSCVKVQRNCQPALQNPQPDHDTEISVYTSQPTFRSFRETVKYEAIGSNITSFERVLERIKSQARRDGCEALVHVKFYKQPIGSGRFSSAFPKIEAVGVVFED